MNKKTTKERIMIMATILFISSTQSSADFYFGDVTNLGSAINTSNPEEDAVISADGLELFFISERAGGLGWTDIWGSKRASKSDTWETAQNLGSKVNTSGLELGPNISYDGLSLYFLAFNRPGGYGRSDIWVSHRDTKADPWKQAVNVGATINGPGADVWPSISADGLSMFFSSTVTGGSDTYYIFESKRPDKNAPWTAPVKLGSTVNTAPGNVSDYPSISANSLALFFASNRPGGYGALDLWVAKRTSIHDQWGIATNLGSTINSSRDETLPNISWDGSVLYISEQHGAATRPGGFGDIDIWSIPIARKMDYDDDGIMNFKDFARLALYWKQNEPLVDIAPLPLGDDIINAGDLLVLAMNWLADNRMLAHWKLDETNGRIAGDSVGANNGALHSDPNWLANDGKQDGALEFDGIDDYVSTDFVLDPADGPFSVHAWVKAGAPEQVVISQVGTTGRSWLAADSEGNLMTHLRAPAGRAFGPPLVSAFMITDGDWHQIGLVWDGSYRHLYTDGEEVATDIDDQKALVGADGGLYFGAENTLSTTGFFDGMIDDIRIYNQAVTP